MNWKSVAIFAALVFIFSACAPKVDSPADIAAIKAISVDYGKAASAGDAKAVANYYTEDAVRLEPNAAKLLGKAAIGSAWQSFLDKYTTDEQDVAEDVWTVNDLGVARGTYAAKATPKIPGGSVIDDKGKWIAIYRRQAGGDWKIVADIWNTDQPVAQVLYPGNAEEQALLQLERDWAAAWQKMDAKALDNLLAPGFVENNDGQITTKAQMIASVRAGAYKVESAQVSDMRVLIFGDQAVVNGLTTAKQTFQGKDISGTLRWTDVWIKRNGRWQPVTTYIVKIG
jgi:uncharacterized protein (TIGR02246 family)